MLGSQRTARSSSSYSKCYQGCEDQRSH